MPKINGKYRLEVYSDNDRMISSYCLDEMVCEDRFLFFIDLAVKVRFHSMYRFRLLSGTHIMFEFRDLRAIVDQKNFLL